MNDPAPRESMAAMAPIVIKVEGMGCAACAAAVQKAVIALAPLAKVNVDLDAGEVKIRDAALPPDTLKAAIAAAGYDVQT